MTTSRFTQISAQLKAERPTLPDLTAVGAKAIADGVARHDDAAFVQLFGYVLYTPALPTAPTDATGTSVELDAEEQRALNARIADAEEACAILRQVWIRHSSYWKTVPATS